MPVYEYEPLDRVCYMCPGRVAAIQSINEPPLTYCPDCGLEVRRVISQVQIKLSDPPQRDTKGFTTWKRSEYGVWEKVSGPGADVLIGSEEDKQTLAAEKKRRVVDLDQDPT